MFNKYEVYFAEKFRNKLKIFYFQFKLYEQPLFIILLNNIINFGDVNSLIVGNIQRKIKVTFNLADLTFLTKVIVKI